MQRSVALAQSARMFDPGGPWSWPPWLFVQRLILPKPDRRHVQQFRGSLAKPGMKGELADAMVVLPETHTLNKRTLVAILLRHQTLITRCPEGHRRINGCACRGKFRVSEQIWDHNKTVVIKLLKQVRRSIIGLLGIG